MYLSDEMVEKDDKKFLHHNIVAELKYMGREIPHRKTITNDDIRFYAWLCRRAVEMLDEKDRRIQSKQEIIDILELK